MDNDIQKQNETIRIKIQHPKIDGGNSILRELHNKNLIRPGIQIVEIDFDRVEYMNSLGLTELINIHREFTEVQKDVQFHFINVNKKIVTLLQLVDMDRIAHIRQKD
jgi:anti-anti-sigma regulatory factor